MQTSDEKSLKKYFSNRGDLIKKYDTQPLDLMQFINTKYHEPFIHARVEFDGELDKNIFSDSIDTLISVFPILKCRYDEKENAFTETENLTGKDLLRVESDADKNSLLTESLNMNEKLIQFTISDNALYITVSHLVCDGGGFKQLIYLLCDIYNGTFEDNCDYLMNRDFSQISKELTGRTEMTVQMLISMLGNYKNRPIYEKGEDDCSYVVERTISKEDMEKIHTAARKQGATLNDVFLAAYARALRRLYGFKKINIPCTADLRKYTKNKTGIANLTGTYNLNIKIADGETFSETLSSVTAYMKKQKITRNDIAGPMLLVSEYEKSSLEKFMKMYGGMNTGAYTDYTNLGVLDESRLLFKGTTVKKAVGYSGLNKAPYFQIAVSSFNGETTISSLLQCTNSNREK
ncbi:MAG: condensation domain-containing protein, partial [Eubacterium sp.]